LAFPPRGGDYRRAAATGVTPPASPKSSAASASSVSARSRSSAAAPSLIDARVPDCTALTLELLAGGPREIVDLRQRSHGGVGISGGVGQTLACRVEPGEQVGECG